VFESSWVLLSPDQQRVLTRLSVFRGGFTRLAACTICGATPYEILSLQHRSLLERRETGRFELHELVRRLAAERLGDDREDLSRRHATFFAQLLVARLGQADAASRGDALGGVSEEFDNVRTAWSFLARARNTRLVSDAAPALYAFCDARSYFSEGAAAFREAIQAYETEPVRDGDAAVVAELRLNLSWFCRNTGLLDEARGLLATSLEAFRALGNERMVSVCLTNLAAVCESLGDLEGCLRFHSQAFEIVSRLDDRRVWARPLGNLARIHAVLGHKAEAEDFFGRAEAIFTETSDTKGLAILNLNRGCLWLDHEEWARAAVYFEKSLVFAREIDMRQIEASNLMNLAEIAFVQGQHDQARELRAESMRLFTEIDDRANVTFGHVMLGYDACRQGRLDAARTCFRTALQSAVELSATTLILDVLVGMAMVLEREGQNQRARAYVAVVEGHPGATAEMRRRAGALASGLDEKGSVRAPGPGLTLGEVVQDLLGNL
jgi:tetratricopeptide (TPR) repeat protein